VVNLKTISIIIAAAVVGVVVFMVFSESEEDRVKKRFTILAEQVEKESGESKFISAARAKKIKGLFAENIVIDIPERSITRELDRRDLGPYVLGGRAKFSEIKLKFYDIKVDFPDSGLADVRVTANLAGQLETGKTIDETHELACSLDKVEDAWLFKRFEAVEVLQR